MAQHIMIHAIDFKSATLRNIMINRIGQENGISKQDILKKMIPTWSQLSDLEQYYYRTKLTSLFSAIKRIGFITVNVNGMIYIPTKMSDLKGGKLRMEANALGWQKSMARNEEFIKKKLWRNL